MIEKAEIWKRRSSNQVADCRVFKVRQDFCERESDNIQHSFFVLENPDWVNVIALTKERKVVLIEQFRHGIEQNILELPGGMIDENEEPEIGARRELLEETGYSAEKFIFLGKSHPNPAIQNNWIYHYLAENCEKLDDVEFDEHESVITKLFDLDEIENLIENETITHSLVLAALLRYFNFVNNKQ